MEIDFEREAGKMQMEKKVGSIPFIKPALIICGDSLNRKSSEYQRLVEIATKNIVLCCGRLSIILDSLSLKNLKALK